jgi:hypothetical protein
VVYARKDSALLERIVWMDTLASLLTSNQKNRNSEMYVLGRYATRTMQFRPGLSTLNFLSKSDVYSSIEDGKVKGKIQAYESNLNWMQKLIDLEEEMSVGLYPYVSSVFDAKVFLGMKQFGYQLQEFTKPSGNPALLTNDTKTVNQLVYHIYIRRSQYNSELTYQNQFNSERKKLIEFLEERYELK